MSRLTRETKRRRLLRSTDLMDTLGLDDPAHREHAKEQLEIHGKTVELQEKLTLGNLAGVVPHARRVAQ